MLLDGKETHWLKKKRFISRQRRLLFKPFDHENIGTYTCRIRLDSNIVEIEFKIRDRNPEKINSVQARLYYPKNKIEVKHDMHEDFSYVNTKPAHNFKSGGLALNFQDEFTPSAFGENTLKVKCSTTGKDFLVRISMRNIYSKQMLLLDDDGSVFWDLPPGMSKFEVLINDTNPYSSILEIPNLSEKYIGFFSCNSNDSASRNSIRMEIIKDGERYSIDWHSTVVAPITLDIVEPVESDSKQNNAYVREFGTELYIDCQSSAGIKLKKKTTILGFNSNQNYSIIKICVRFGLSIQKYQQTQSLKTR